MYLRKTCKQSLFHTPKTPKPYALIKQRKNRTPSVSCANLSRACTCNQKKLQAISCLHSLQHPPEKKHKVKSSDKPFLHGNIKRLIKNTSPVCMKQKGKKYKSFFFSENKNNSRNISGLSCETREPALQATR